MRTIFVIPPLRQLTGGLTNIYTIAGLLAGLGRDVALTGPSPEAAGLADAAAHGLPWLPWGEAPLASDIWCVPESWPNAMTPGLQAKAQVLVYVQSWVYLLGLLPAGVRWRQMPVRYLAVSEPVAWFMYEALRLSPDDILPPSVDPAFFLPGERPQGHVRVACMPRKNRPLAEQIQQVADACLAELPGAPGLEWVSIHKMTRQEVAAELASCHLFLSTGFPEGFGLPPLEAMATGCVPIGFTGFGGWEYMRQARIGECASTYGPPFPLPENGVPASGNGFFFADGDTLATGMALAKVVCLAHENGEAWRSLRAACRATAERYSLDRQRRRLAGLFPA